MRFPSHRGRRPAFSLTEFHHGIGNHSNYGSHPQLPVAHQLTENVVGTNLSSIVIFAFSRHFLCPASTPPSSHRRRPIMSEPTRLLAGNNPAQFAYVAGSRGRLSHEWSPSCPSGSSQVTTAANPMATRIA